MNLKEQLRRQLKFLETSCKEYDAGNLEEAIRLGTTLRVLFHNTGASTSLLVHLSSSHIKMLSTCEKIPATANWWTNLADIKLWPQEEVFDLVPKLATAKTQKNVSFTHWWETEIVYLKGTDKVRRKDMVLYAANKDGGGSRPVPASKKVSRHHQWPRLPNDTQP